MGEVSKLLAQPATERFDGSEAWTQLPANVQAEIGALALELVATSALMNRVEEDELPRLFRRVADAASLELDRDLYALVTDALPADALVASDGWTPRIPSLLGGVCRGCGCSQNDACDEGCGWAAEDLCTACVEGGAE